jgi:hypothetical protein
LIREIGKDFHRNFWGFLGENEEEIVRIPFPQLIWKKEQQGGRIWWEEIGGNCARAGDSRLCPGVEDNTVARGRTNRLLCGLRGRDRMGWIRPKLSRRIFITFPIKLINEMIFELLKILPMLK